MFCLRHQGNRRVIFFLFQHMRAPAVCAHLYLLHAFTPNAPLLASVPCTPCFHEPSWTHNLVPPRPSVLDLLVSCLPAVGGYLQRHCAALFGSASMPAAAQHVHGGSSIDEAGSPPALQVQQLLPVTPLGGFAFRCVSARILRSLVVVYG